MKTIVTLSNSDFQKQKEFRKKIIKENWENFSLWKMSYELAKDDFNRI